MTVSAIGNSHTRLCALAAGDYDPEPLVRTGIHALDRALFGGIPLDQLAVIAARTSHGKTATTVKLAVNTALDDARTVVVLWCEDKEVRFDLRALSVLSGTGFLEVLDAYREKRLAPIWQRVPERKREAWRANCLTVHLDRPPPEEVADLVKAHPGAVILLDHLGEIDWGAGKKHELIGDGLRLIRSAMLTHRSLFIGMTQLNRDWDRRKAASSSPEKVRPVLSDIENSGQIEQVARVMVIAEKIMHWQEGQEQGATGEYRYHVFKPTLGVASCRWHEATATPDNLEPEVNPEPAPVLRLAASAPPEHWSEPVEADEPGSRG